MRPRTLRQRKNPDYLETYVEVNEEELDPCKVWFDASPAEPDVNWPGGLEIEMIEYKGEDITDHVGGAELDSLAERIEEYLNACAEDERY